MANATSDLEGVYMMLDLQLIDVEIREPVKNQVSTVIETLFPGQYAPWVTYTYLLVHRGATVMPNNTLPGGNVGHISQVLYTKWTVYPYTLNPNAVKLNSRYMVLADEAEITDPVVNYAYPGG
ncbi:hypothetical protein SCUP234_01658 [Seiridium cupressi]